MRSALEKDTGQKKSLEEDLKSLQKTVSDLHKAFETWKHQKPRTENKVASNNTNIRNRPNRECYKCGSESTYNINVQTIKAPNLIL